MPVVNATTGGTMSPLPGKKLPKPNPLRLPGAPVGKTAGSTATQVPQYQPVGAIRERSESLDPASFQRRTQFDLQRQMAGQGFDQQAREAKANAVQQNASAGLTGGAALANTNAAVRGVNEQRTNTMMGLGAEEAGQGAQASLQTALQRLSGEQRLGEIGAQSEAQRGLQELIGTQRLGEMGYEDKTHPGLRIPGIDRDLSPREYETISGLQNTLIAQGVKFEDAQNMIRGNVATWGTGNYDGEVRNIDGKQYKYSSRDGWVLMPGQWM